MTLTRRSFFRLAAGAALAPVAAKIALALPSAPMLWGDGIHDDTEALQALIDGDVVEFATPEAAEGAGWIGKTLRIPRGKYRMTTHPIFNRAGPKWVGVTVDGEGSTFLRDGGHYCCFEIGDAQDCTFQNMKSIPLHDDDFTQCCFVIRSAPAAIGQHFWSGAPHDFDQILPPGDYRSQL